MIALVPADDARALGGLRQQRVVGTINGADFTSNVMPRGGRQLALSVSMAMMKAGGASPGDEIDVALERAATEG